MVIVSWLRMTWRCPLPLEWSVTRERLPLPWLGRRRRRGGDKRPLSCLPWGRRIPLGTAVLLYTYTVHTHSTQYVHYTGYYTHIQYIHVHSMCIIHSIILYIRLLTMAEYTCTHSTQYVRCIRVLSMAVVRCTHYRLLNNHLHVHVPVPRAYSISTVICWLIFLNTFYTMGT